MHVDRAGRQLVIQAPAKLNLFLEVLGRRADGYHELETLMCPVSLYDTLTFEPVDNDDSVGHARSPIDFACDWGPLRRTLGAESSDDSSRATPPEWPEPERNLVVRALDLLRDLRGVRATARVRLTKRIPVAAGLGGGSSDAAAALVAGNLGWRLGLTDEELSRCAAQLGSDIPFFLARRAAVCRGRGERVEPVALGAPGWFVIVRPASGLATAEVFRACRPCANGRDANQVLEALRAGGWERAGRELYNALEPAAESLNSEIARLREEFDQLDVLGHQMSGSGTSYFAVCRHARQARQIGARLRGRGLGHAFVVTGCR